MFLVIHKSMRLCLYILNAGQNVLIWDAKNVQNWTFNIWQLLVQFSDESGFRVFGFRIPTLSLFLFSVTRLSTSMWVMTAGPFTTSACAKTTACSTTAKQTTATQTPACRTILESIITASLTAAATAMCSTGLSQVTNWNIVQPIKAIQWPVVVKCWWKM